MRRQNRNHRGQTNSPFEGHRLLSLSRQQREEREGEGGRQGGRMLQLVARDVGPGESEAGRTGGRNGGGEVEVWAGNGEKEGGESCQCISIFTLQPRWLSHPVHPSAIPPSLAPPRVSLFPRQPPPMSP